MNTKEIIGLNYYSENNSDIIQKHLKVIKPFCAVEKEVPLDLMEKYVGLIQRKYALQVDYICPIFVPGEDNVYSATVRRTDTNKYLTYIYGKTIYEVFCKICILYHAVTYNKSFPLADWEGQKQARAKRIKTIHDGGKNEN